MKRALTTILAAAAALTAAHSYALAQEAPQRPAISAVSHLAVYAEDPAASEAYYTQTLGAVKRPDPENPDGTRYYFSPSQFVEVLPLPAEAAGGKNRLAHAAFNTDDAEGLRLYLAANGVDVPDGVETGADGSKWFSVSDPESKEIRFVETPGTLPDIPTNPLSDHMIHVGYIVHDRALQDGFWRDILGFRPYWQGGPDPDAPPQWVSLQVPDGSDWLEYMVVGAPGGAIPEDMSQRVVGIFNHFALGTGDITQPYEHLWMHGLVTEEDELPKIGADAKWQLNLYDPDGTRAEFMEFAPVGEPCCSPFTADHPAD